MADDPANTVDRPVAKASDPRVVVVGMGTQGRKRKAVAQDACVATVDPVQPADFLRLSDVPLDSYDAALVCTGDAPKVEVITHLLERGKHVLVEKPLLAPADTLRRLRDTAQARNLACYTAYNHRFEPHIARMAEVIASGRLGAPYHCRLVYGNGTARDVRTSAWRDQGSGVLADLGSHLFDCLLFWFGDLVETITVHSATCFENRAFDHVVLGLPDGRPVIELEMSLLAWRNRFACDLFAEHGSAHIDSLMKWGPATLTHRQRILPSGRPPEEATTLVGPDPTWQAEYDHFKDLCRRGGTTLDKDIVIGRLLETASRLALGGSRPS